MNKKSIADVFCTTRFMKKMRLHIRCIGISLVRCFVPFEDENEHRIAVENGKKAKKALFYTVFSFLMTLAKINLGIYPFGIPLLVSTSGMNVLYSLCGYLVSCLVRGYEGIVSFVTGFLVYLVRKAVSEDKFNETVGMRMIVGVTASAVAAGSALFAAGLEIGSAFSFVTQIVLSVICIYLFCGVFVPGFNKTSEGLYTLSVYALCSCFVTAFCDVFLFGIDLSAVAAAVITLWLSKCKGPVYGCVCGFITGFCSTNPLFSASLGISGLVSGYLFTKSKMTACVANVLSCYFSGLYLFGLDCWKTCLVPPLTAAAVFVLFEKHFPDVFKVKMLKNKRIEAEERGGNEFERVSNSLSGLSSVIYKFAEHLKAPSDAEISDVFDSAFDEVCKSCSMSSMCYAKRECNFPEIKNKTVSMLKHKKLGEEELSDMLLRKCIKVNQLCESINAKYSELSFMCMRTNRTQTVAGIYNSMSRLIKSTSGLEKDNKLRDLRLEKSLGDALTKANIPFSYVTVNGSRFKHIYVHGVRADKIPFSSKQLSLYLSEECGIKLSEPEFDISDSADLVMKLTRGEILELEYAQCCESKSDDDVNGDTVSFFSNDRGYFYCVISDGMGSGKNAAATSRLSCVLLEKLLCADTAKNVCLELLNNLLLSKNDETFSTVDMLEVDKLGGSAYFVKAGAAPSFVLRNNHLYKIDSRTPPVGIIPAFSAESTRFTLEKGDVIFMFSDGIMQSDSDAVWLSELIKLDSNNEPAFLASELVRRARTINERRDDASACVVKVV